MNGSRSDRELLSQFAGDVRAIADKVDGITRKVDRAAARNERIEANVHHLETKVDRNAEAAIIATANLPRRTGLGMESETAAAERGAVDAAIAGLLFQGGLQRSEAASFTWGDMQDAGRRPRHPGSAVPVQDRPGRHRRRRALSQEP